MGVGLQFFIYNGFSTLSIPGMHVISANVYETAERSVELYEIPGRNQPLIVDGGRYLPVDVVYHCFIKDSFDAKMTTFRQIFKNKGFYRLEDSYHTDEFYKARIVAPLDVVTHNMRTSGEFDVLFERDPRRFLKTGETAVTVASGDSITNPTDFDSQPLIVVTGSGQLQIGQTTITIASGFTSVTIDCEMMDCYSGTQSANDKVTFSGNNFPTLKPGSNGVVYGSGITNVTITPRWWRV